MHEKILYKYINKTICDFINLERRFVCEVFKSHCQGQKNSIVVKVLALHTANSSMILDTGYSPPITSRSDAPV